MIRKLVLVSPNVALTLGIWMVGFAFMSQNVWARGSGWNFYNYASPSKSCTLSPSSTVRSKCHFDSSTGECEGHCDVSIEQDWQCSGATLPQTQFCQPTTTEIDVKHYITNCVTSLASEVFGCTHCEDVAPTDPVLFETSNPKGQSCSNLSRQ